MKKPSLVKDWKQAHRWNSVRLAALWAAVNGLVAGLPWLAGYVDPWKLIAINMAGYVLIAIARIFKQPGLD